MEINTKTVEALLQEAGRAHPNECCGLLLGVRAQVETIQPAINTHPTPETHFEIDPAALIAASKAERNGGPEIIGFYHSHPSGKAEPSATDRAMAAHDGKVWAIIAQDEVRFWRDDPDGFRPLSYSVSDA